MNWHIGQEIVAILPHARTGIKVGDEFVIKALQSPECNCKTILIDIGKRTDGGFIKCGLCNNSGSMKTNIWWLDQAMFAPKRKTIEYSGITAEQLIEQLETQTIKQ